MAIGSLANQTPAVDDPSSGTEWEMKMAFLVSGGPRLGGRMDGVGEARLWIEDVGLDGTCYRLHVGFAEPRGYGDRCYQIQITPESFKTLAEAMIRRDRDEAIKAFGAALQMNPAEPKGRYWSPEIEAEPKAA
jgi:hypothetical protein